MLVRWCQVKLGPQLDNNRSIPAIDLSYYSRIASVTRITRKAITKPAPFSSQYSRSSSDAVAEPFWLQVRGRATPVSRINAILLIADSPYRRTAPPA